MRILVLGGTAWLGGAVARRPWSGGHAVTALARGGSGSVPAGASCVRADRGLPTRMPVWQRPATGTAWSTSRGSPATSAPRSRHWADGPGTGSSSPPCSVYAAHDTPGADESAAVLPALVGDEATPETYGEGKVACEEAVLSGVGTDRRWSPGPG